MKKVFLYFGMGSCVSAEDQKSDAHHSSMRIVGWSSASDKKAETHMEKPVTEQTPVCKSSSGSKDEMFFDSKPWLDSDDEDFVSVYGDSSPAKQANEGDHQGRRLSELFRDSSFSRDSQTSQKANSEANGKDQKSTTMKFERKKSGKMAQRCLPSLVRTLSCGDRKKRLNPSHVAVVG